MEPDVTDNISEDILGLIFSPNDNAISEDPVVSTNEMEDELIDEEDPMKSNERSGLQKLLSSAIGTDLTSMAVPVTYNEPLSFLQRMCEYLKYSVLLDKVCDYKNGKFRYLNSRPTIVQIHI